MTAADGRRGARDGGGFDRIPGRGERHGSDHPLGRAALFSAAADERQQTAEATATTAPPGFGLAVTCSACHTVSPISPLGLMWALFPFTAVLPWRPNYLLGACPACHRRAWLGVGLRW